jgi:hypothetical protein
MARLDRAAQATARLNRSLDHPVKPGDDGRLEGKKKAATAGPPPVVFAP